MEAISQYIRSVTGAALISAVVLRLLDGKSSAGAIGKILVGIFLALTVIGPLAQVRLLPFAQWLPDISDAAGLAAADGEATAKKALAENITERVEAYILDKAAQMDVSLQVRVELTDDTIPVPCRVWLQGSVSPYAKTKLQSIIREDLGIDKENQIWN